MENNIFIFSIFTLIVISRALLQIIRNRAELIAQLCMASLAISMAYLGFFEYSAQLHAISYTEKKQLGLLLPEVPGNLYEIKGLDGKEVIIRIFEDKNKETLLSVFYSNEGFVASHPDEKIQKAMRIRIPSDMEYHLAATNYDDRSASYEGYSPSTGSLASFKIDLDTAQPKLYFKDVSYYIITGEGVKKAPSLNHVKEMIKKAKESSE